MGGSKNTTSRERTPGNIALAGLLWETFQASKELALAKMVDQNYQPA